MKSSFVKIIFFVSVFFVCDLAVAATGNMTGLPLPRFASFRANQINLRTGPGSRYPVKWVYLRSNMPIEIIGEYDNWRKIRDWDGTKGWVHKTLLHGRRTFRVVGGDKILRKAQNENARPAAKLEGGVFGRLLECPKLTDFCRVEVQKIEGWLKRNEFWGVYAGEYID